MNGHAYPYDRPLVVPPMQFAPDPLVQFSGDVQRLRLGPDDRLVLKLDTAISADVATQLRTLLGRTCNIDPGRVIVLGLGMNLAVLGPEGGE